MKGKILEGKGIVLENDNAKVVHLILKADDTIKPHNHVGYSICFTVVKGNIEVFLDEKEKHVLKGGDVLSFDGDAFISANANDDCDIYVFLIKK